MHPSEKISMWRFFTKKSQSAVVPYVQNTIPKTVCRVFTKRNTE